MINRRSSGLGGGANFSIALIAFAVLSAIIWYYRYPIVRFISETGVKKESVKLNQKRENPQTYNDKEETNSGSEDIVDKDFLPSAQGEVINHTYYTLSYREDHELPEWVAYDMSTKELNAPNLGRYNRFNPDPKVTTKSASHGDYSGSGYTRGHMAPAGDMAFDAIAMQESFYMSNMCPQVREYNNGVWKELEENVRDWAYKAGTLIIVTGPVLSNPIKRIGRQSTKITVPSSFYKVLYDAKNDKAIGFVIPHKRSEERLESYMMSIDEVERITGLDFFANLFSNNEEHRIESVFDGSLWNVSEKRFQLRINKWNWE
jgi:endonuclease G